MTTSGAGGPQTTRCDGAQRGWCTSGGASRPAQRSRRSAAAAAAATQLLLRSRCSVAASAQPAHRSRRTAAGAPQPARRAWWAAACRRLGGATRRCKSQSASAHAAAVNFPPAPQVYGENMAILAGDAMLTYAFEHIARDTKGVPADRLLRVIAELGRASGADGLVGGQVSSGAWSAMTRTSKSCCGPSLAAAACSLKGGQLLHPPPPGRRPRPRPPFPPITPGC